MQRTKPSAIIGACQVACNHDSLAVEAVEEHARDRAGGEHGHGSREKNARDHKTSVCVLHRQTHDRDVVEVIAHFAHDLAEPGEPVVTVRAQQSGEGTHEAASGHCLIRGWTPWHSPGPRQHSLTFPSRDRKGAFHGPQRAAKGNEDALPVWGQGLGPAAELPLGAERYVRAGSTGDLVAGTRTDRVFNGVAMPLRATEMNEDAGTGKHETGSAGDLCRRCSSTERFPRY